MIQISKSELSTDNKNELHNLKQQLNNLMINYGNDYSLIPKNLKNNLFKRLRNIDKLMEILLTDSHHKCVYCEAVLDTKFHIDHFYPKGRYSCLAFEWENLLPSCYGCNDSKLEHDTALEPIVNPLYNNPSDFFQFDGISIIPVRGCLYFEEVAERTIRVCNLEQYRTWKARGDLLVSLKECEQTIQKILIECTSPTKTRNRSPKLRKLLDKIEILAEPQQTYSFFCKYFYENSVICQEASNIV